MNFYRFLTLTTWWGKILGAFFGYLILGSVGAFLGILIGNFFDKGLISHFSPMHWLFYSEKRKAVQNAFFETTFLTMGFIAKADGRVSEHELSTARTIMNEMRLNHLQKQKAKNLFNQGKYLLDLNNLLVKFHAKCYDNQALLRMFVDIQYRIIQADGITADKIKVLNEILTSLGFAPFQKQHQFYEHFTNTNQSHQKQSDPNWNQQPPKDNYNSLDFAFRILGIPSSAKKQEVKKAYRRLLSINHPDKLIAKGASEAEIKIANEKTQSIVKAYELICQTKGW